MRIAGFKRVVIIGLCLLNCFTVLATTVSETVYINRGTITTVNNTVFPYLTYNATAQFSATTAVINIAPGDVLNLKIINTDSVTHGFNINGYIGVNKTIFKGDSASITFSSAKEAVFVYYDSYQYPTNRYMGLGGIISVSNVNSKKYYWNLKEHQTFFNETLDSGKTVNWSNYYPDYFTVNGLSYPDLQNDSTAKVTAKIGDTIHIFVANTGQSAHSIHFHGFHCKVLYASDPRQEKRVKDTFPLKSMDCILLEMIPDKLGQYSVHDHNLVAVSGGSKHPNGMFIIMKIE